MARKACFYIQRALPENQSQSSGQPSIGNKSFGFRVICHNLMQSTNWRISLSDLDNERNRVTSICCQYRTRRLFVVSEVLGKPCNGEVLFGKCDLIWRDATVAHVRSPQATLCRVSSEADIGWDKMQSEATPRS